jgi:hypothetical protein
VLELGEGAGVTVSLVPPTGLDVILDDPVLLGEGARV